MLLAIDIGNTRTKAAVFEEASLLEQFSFGKNELQKNIYKIFDRYPKISDLIVSSVGSEHFAFPIPDRIQLNVVNNHWNFPFVNRYETPTTLGIDRMVLAAGATLRFPNTNRLIIDVGTCITYDFIDSEDNYHGGAISPGLKLRYISLNNYTAKLPLLDLSAPKDLVGKSTAESIHSGVVNGVVNEIDGFIEAYQKTNSNFIIILTGGDAEFLAERLKNTIFANSNFLLESLNQTFQYTIKND